MDFIIQNCCEDIKPFYPTEFKELCYALLHSDITTKNVKLVYAFLSPFRLLMLNNNNCGFGFTHGNDDSTIPLMNICYKDWSSDCMKEHKKL